MLEDGRRDQRSERAEQVGAGLEAVLVEVVARAPARAQHEVALEVRVLAQRGAELVAIHPRAATRSSRAGESSRSASGAPLPTVTNEPSSKYSSTRSRLRARRRRRKIGRASCRERG